MGGKVVSLSYSFAFLGPPPQGYIFLNHKTYKFQCNVIFIKICDRIWMKTKWSLQTMKDLIFIRLKSVFALNWAFSVMVSWTFFFILSSVHNGQMWQISMTKNMDILFLNLIFFYVQVKNHNNVRFLCLTSNFYPSTAIWLSLQNSFIPPPHKYKVEKFTI